MKPWLVFDVDDVLYDFVRSLHTISKINGQLRNPDESYKEWKNYNHLEFINFDNQESFRKYMVESGVLETNYAIAGGKEFMNWAKEHFSLGFITARGFHPEAEKVTRSFLRNNLDIEADKIIISGLYGDKKITYLNQFDGAPVKLFVDDNSSHVQDFHSNDVNSLVFAQKWNEGINEHLIKVNSFEEIRSFVETNIMSNNLIKKPKRVI